MTLAISLAEQADRPAEWPGFGRLASGPLRLVVVPDSRRLDSLTLGRAPRWGAAVALPALRTIVIRADGENLPRTLRHELAHLALHQQVNVRVPLWFDEGYAAWAAGEWERLGSLELNLAVARGALPGLRQLDGALRGTETSADAAYALAASAVTELARRNPSGSLAPLLRQLHAGYELRRRGPLDDRAQRGSLRGGVAADGPSAIRSRDLAPGRRRVGARGHSRPRISTLSPPSRSAAPRGARRGVGNRAGTAGWE